MKDCKTKVMKDWNEKSLNEIIEFMEKEKAYYREKLVKLTNDLDAREKEENISGEEWHEWEEMILGCGERIKYITDTLVSFYRIIKDNDNRRMGEEINDGISVSNKIEYTPTMTGNDFLTGNDIEINYEIV